MNINFIIKKLRNPKAQIFKAKVKKNNKKFTSFVNFDDAVIADSFEEAEKGNLVGTETGHRVVGADVVYENRSGGERRQYQSLPQALASLQSRVRCPLPHFALLDCQKQFLCKTLNP